MKKVVIEINDKYSGALSLTAIGGGIYNINVATGSADLSKTDKIVIDEQGYMITLKENNNGRT
jgi:hypothetical protein